MLDKARDFVVRNARLLERQRFAFHFDGGAAAPVLAALAAYQNVDGGFGNALEPDKRVPDSQPVDVQVALETMDIVGAFDAAMAQRACDWLATVTTPEGGVPFSLPSANAWPHAPWWQAADNPPADLNPTAAIAGVLRKYGVAHPWIGAAEDYCWRAWEKYDGAQFHTLTPMLVFFAHAFDSVRADKARTQLLERVAAPGVVAIDPDAGGYVQKPLAWAPFPNSPCRRLFSDAVIAKHLDALAAKQDENGSWPLSWDPISPGIELEWRGVRTIEALRTLRAYGRL